MRKLIQLNYLICVDQKFHVYNISPFDFSTIVRDKSNRTNLITATAMVASSSKMCMLATTLTTTIIVRGKNHIRDDRHYRRQNLHYRPKSKLASESASTADHISEGKVEPAVETNQNEASAENVKDSPLLNQRSQQGGFGGLKPHLSVFT